MQLDPSRLLDLLAQNLRRSLVVYLGPDTRLVHSSVCARICFAIASFPTASSRLRACPNHRKGTVFVGRAGWRGVRRDLASPLRFTAPAEGGIDSKDALLRKTTNKRHWVTPVLAQRCRFPGYSYFLRAAIPTSREFRTAVGIYDTGYSVTRIGWVDYSYTWPLQMWAGDYYDD